MNDNKLDGLSISGTSSQVIFLRRPEEGFKKFKKMINCAQITVLFLIERKVLDIMPHFTGINFQIRLKHVPL